MWSCIGVVAAMVGSFGILVVVDIATKPDKFGNIQTSWTPLPASMPKDNQPFTGTFTNACQKVSEQEVQNDTGKTIVAPGKYSPEDNPIDGGVTSQCEFDFPGGSVSIFISQDPVQDGDVTTPEDDLKGDNNDCKHFHIVESYNAPMSVCVREPGDSPTGLDMVVGVSRIQNGNVRDAQIYWTSYPGDPDGTADKVTPRLDGLASLLAQRM